MSDMIVRDDQTTEKALHRPPLYLQHYLDERDGRLFSEQASKPPGGRSAARVVERRGNLIVLDFRDAGVRRPPRLRRLCRNAWDAVMLLFLLGTAAACVAAFLR